MLDQLLFEGIVGLVSWWHQDEAANFCGISGESEATIKLHSLNRDAAGDKLHFHLHKPYLTVGGSEGRELHINWCNVVFLGWVMSFGHAFASIRVTNVN